jgi:hypothetical protein
MNLYNALMLFGLAGVAIPIIIHLLNRRRYDVVDWGAMQFLQVSEVTRRRLLLEELLLMLLRMGLIAVLVYALAGPYSDNSLLGKTGERPPRDVVLIFDGSYSMGYTGTGRSAHEAAKEWAREFLGDLPAGSAVALLQAKQQVVPLLGELSHDLDRARERIDHLAPPAGGCDWPGAFQAALALLAKSQRAEREIVMLSDGQRFGWADEDTLRRWDLLAQQLGYRPGDREGEARRPRLWMVNLDPTRPKDPPNWSLTPLRAGRPVVSAEQQVTFRTELELRGQTAYRPPHRIRLEVDGKPVRDLEAPRAAKIENGKVPLSFVQRFTAPGSHLVSVVLEPDPPPGERPPGYVLKDQLPGDNRQDFAVEVLPALPVLLVDGDPNPAAKRRGSDFLRDALAPARDRTPVVRARVVSVEEFDPTLLSDDAGPGRGNEPLGRPRVLILCNVARLSGSQQEAVDRFLADGGGVLVTLGSRAEADAYNNGLYRKGEGWLPARLDGMEGDETQLQAAVRPAPAASAHPALELFRETPAGGLEDARFPRWWKLTTAGRGAPGVPVAGLRSATAERPFLVERAYRGGRVLLCSVPLDNTWGTNLVDLPAFVPLAHELVYYLAGARSAEYNLAPGQPLRYRLESEAPLERFTLQPPEGEAKQLTADPADKTRYAARVLRQPQGAVLVHEGNPETGVYRLRTPEGRTVYYVARPDPRESDLSPCTDEDRARVARLLPVRYENEREQIAAALADSGRRQEYWWWLLLGLVGLLCAEVLMTRRMVKGRQS